MLIISIIVSASFFISSRFLKDVSNVSSIFHFIASGAWAITAMQVFCS
jgi:hypothetical protein